MSNKQLVQREADRQGRPIWCFTAVRWIYPMPHKCEHGLPRIIAVLNSMKHRRQLSVMP